MQAGNETYDRGEILATLGSLTAQLGFDPESLIAMGRVHPDDAGERSGLTPLAIRAARSTNAVSTRHGGVAREMWHEMFPDEPVDRVPISHVTNGVHLPTWMAPPMRAVLTRHFGEGWERHATDPDLWKGVEAIRTKRSGRPAASKGATLSLSSGERSS